MVVGYEMSYVRNVSDWEGIYSSFKMSKISMAPLIRLIEGKCMAMLNWIDKELSFSVYLKSSHNIIELYKDDKLCLMFN